MILTRKLVLPEQIVKQQAIDPVNLSDVRRLEEHILIVSGLEDPGRVDLVSLLIDFFSGALTVKVCTKRVISILLGMVEVINTSKVSVTEDVVDLVDLDQIIQSLTVH